MTDISSVTWNGGNMSQAAKRANYIGANAGIWYLTLGTSASPTTGTITVTYAANFLFQITATSYSNVDQSSPVLGANTNSSADLTVASETGSIVIDSIIGPGPTGAPAAGQTLVAVERDMVFDTVTTGASTAPGASSVLMNWPGISATFLGDIAHAGVSITSTNPSVTSVSPAGGPTAGGATVTITGRNFTGATAVKFGATAAASYAVNSATQITATTPSGSAGIVDVQVTAGGFTSAISSADQYTYVLPPSVTGISPTAGPATGGTSVVITGTNFSNASAVTFGATPATSFTVNSTTQITATAPAGAGTVDVRVTTLGGTSPTSASDRFTYVPAPAVTSLSPTIGPATGGSTVTITGTNFSGASAVTFGANPAASFTVNSATQITATSPAGTGTVDVRVTSVGGTSAVSAADQFSFIPAPVVTAVSPTIGPPVGGTSVTITGSNFVGATAVTFGATAASSFTVNSASQITATSPAGIGTVDIRVTTAGGTSATSAADQFAYIPAPVVTGVAPNAGPTSGGTSVTVTGTNFNGATAVTFSGTSATSFTVNSATQITATSPAGVGTVDVRVTTLGGTSATTAADQFTYVPAPVVTSLSPSAGPTAGGSSVTIGGTNFNGTTAVTFGGTPATSFVLNSSTSITAVAPAGAGAVDIRVTTTGGTSATSAAAQYIYVPLPVVSSIAPTAGPATGGTSVVVTGTNLSGASAVTFGATPAASFTVNSATQITATAPAGIGTVDVKVTTVGGTSATAAGDQFTFVPAPVVTGVAPNAGPTNGGTTVTITGTSLTGATAVSFSGTAATAFTVNSATQITATSPAGVGTVDVRVTTLGGTSATSAADQFTYVPVPTITSISPVSGPTGGGTTVSITGTNFSGATAVKFGAASATGFTVISATSITATSPAGSGAVDVTVTTVGGTSAISAADVFNFTRADHFSVTVPGVATAGSAFGITVTALDSFNNVASGYTGTVHLTTTDSASGTTVPLDYTFTAGDMGVRTFANGVTLVTAGTHTVTATDTGMSSISGTSGAIVVSPGATNRFVLTAPAAAVPGEAVSMTLTALDAFNNVTPAYRGTVAFTKTDSGAGASVPPNYTFVAGDNGAHTFVGGFTFATPGQQKVTATDTLTPGITGFATVNVGTLNPSVVQLVPTDPVTGLPLPPGSSYPVNSQSGLFEVRTGITNTTAFPINGFRLSVDYSAYLVAQPSLRLYNSSSAPGVSPAFINYPFPVAVGETITLKLQFYTSTRRLPNPFNPTLAVTTLAASEVPSNDGSGVQPRINVRPNGAILLEWDSIPGTWYRVKYSGDMTNWYDSPVPVQANANRTQWLDDGAPFTDVSPATVQARFYRLSVIAAPTP